MEAELLAPEVVRVGAGRAAGPRVETGGRAEVRVETLRAPPGRPSLAVSLAVGVLRPAVVHAAPVADVVLVKYLVGVVRAGPEDRQRARVDREDALPTPSPAAPHTSVGTFGR